MLLHPISCLQVKDALGVLKPPGVKNPHDNELFRIGCSQVWYEVSFFDVHLRSAATYIRVNLQRSIQSQQERLAEIKLQITAIGAEIQICQAVIEAPKLPEELLKAQEELKGMAAELKSLQMQLSKVTHSLLG